jgi:hypothetical protein
MNVIRSINHSVLFPFLFAIAVASAPAQEAKDCGAIPLTNDLLDKMDAFVKTMTGDAAAKAELVEIGKDSTANTTSEGWVSAVNSKCPKTAANLKSAGISVEDFAKGMFALLACSMSEDLAKSEDAVIKANAEFIKANNARATKTFADFMQLTMPATP